jgi:hypothetical protein
LERLKEINFRKLDQGKSKKVQANNVNEKRGTIRYLRDNKQIL